MLKIIRTKKLSEKAKKGILRLWNNEYPYQLNFDKLIDLEMYLDKLDEKAHILVIDESDAIKGWYFDFERDNEKWFAIILDSAVKGNGLGTQILDMAKEKESQLSGWVIDHNNDVKRNGQIYISPINFYLKNGFKKLKNIRLELDTISAVKIYWSRQ